MEQKKVSRIKALLREISVFLMDNQIQYRWVFRTKDSAQYECESFILLIFRYLLMFIVLIQSGQCHFSVPGTLKTKTHISSVKLAI